MSAIVRTLFTCCLVGLLGSLTALPVVFGAQVQGGQAVQSVRPAEVWFGEELAVSYRARVEGDWLVIEARHEPGWHTYSMDNLIRARVKTGRPRPDTELPTTLTTQEGPLLSGEWRQSRPSDFSQPDLRWYTWGFEGTIYFAVPVDSVKLPSSVLVDGQACTDQLCAMIDTLIVPVARKVEAAERSVDPKSLVPVLRE